MGHHTLGIPPGNSSPSFLRLFHHISPFGWLPLLTFPMACIYMVRGRPDPSQSHPTQVSFKVSESDSKTVSPCGSNPLYHWSCKCPLHNVDERSRDRRPGVSAAPSVCPRGMGLSCTSLLSIASHLGCCYRRSKSPA